jgi:hypothetical protein
MNLVGLRQKIKNITDYSPELAQFNDQMDELINDAYYELWSYKRWNFATKRGFLDLHPDITPYTDLESGASAVNANVTFGDRKVTFSHNIGRLKNVDVWEGQPIEIQSREYTISRIETGNSLLLTEAFEGNNSSDDITWVIKKRFYDLPEDCLELLYCGYRDFPYASIPIRGKATGLLPRTEEDYDLRGDFTNDWAEAYIPSPSLSIPAGELLKAELNAAAGSIPTGYYELCYAFLKDGKVGPLSEPYIHQQTGEGGQSIELNFYSWDNQLIFADSYVSADQFSPQWEGYKKVLFWNKNFNRSTGERIGLPCWLQVTNGGTRGTDAYIEPIVVRDIDSSVIISNFNSFDNGNARYVERDGQHQQVRFYPRPIGFDTKKVISVGEEQETIYFRQMVTRYFKKPQDLLLDTDTPEMPYEFHQLIATRALQNIYLKLGQQGLASTYERKFDKDVKELQKRYVDKIDQHIQRGQFNIGQARGRYDSSQLKWKG